MLDKTRREIDSMLQAALDEATACLRDWEEMTDAPERLVRAAQARENTAKRRLQRFRTEVQHDTQNWGDL
jgi:Flp pilus assembly protein TadG